MIRIYGDVHGLLGLFFEQVNRLGPEYEVVQLGDFGWWPTILREHEAAVKYDMQDALERRVYFIDGNHEHFPSLWAAGRYVVNEIMPNLVYIPRGEILELDGRKILFIGGGESPDMNWRTEGVNWFREETITYADVMRIDQNAQVDMMITHVPPFHVSHHIFGGDTPVEWNYSSKLIEAVWESMGKPDLYCGHFHMSRQIGNVRVLNELEFVDV